MTALPVPRWLCFVFGTPPCLCLHVFLFVMISFNECVTITSSKCVKVCVCLHKRECVCMGVRVCVWEREWDARVWKRRQSGWKSSGGAKASTWTEKFFATQRKFSWKEIFFCPVQFQGSGCRSEHAVTGSNAAIQTMKGPLDFFCSTCLPLGGFNHNFQATVRFSMTSVVD